MLVATRVTGTAALVSLLVLSQPAFAFDPSGNDIADGFLKSLETGDTSDVSYGSVSTDGDTVTVTDLKIDYKQDDDSGTATVGTVKIINGTIDSEGVMSADTVDLDTIALEEPGGDATVKIATGSVTNPRFPTETGGEDAAKKISKVADYDKAEFTGLVFTSEDGMPLPIDKVVAEVTKRIDNEPRGGTLSVERAVIKTDSLDDDDTKAQLEALGYTEVVINVDAAGDWNSDDGRATLDAITIDAENMGTLTLSGEFNGLTPEVIEQLQGEQKDISQLMQVLQGVSVADLGIRFQDLSVTGRALKHSAEEQGVTVDQLVDRLTSEASAMLQALNNKAFEDQVVSAVKAFLSDPKSLEVAAKPAQPVPFPQIVGTAMMAPQTLPTVLSVAVTANQDPAPKADAQ